jgi:multicomponent Na+:H+ antiporter subunit D
MDSAAFNDVMLTGTTLAADWVIVLPVVLALLGAAGLLILPRRGGLHVVFSLVIVIGIIAYDVVMLTRVQGAGPFSMTMGGWMPPFGITFAVDVFGAAFALAAAVVTLAVLVYAGNPPEDRSHFHALVLLLLAGVTGAFLTGDIFNLYVWFEVLLIASFGLIVQGGSPLQLDGAVKYGFLNFVATSLFLLSLGLLHGLLGTLNMADILRLAPAANPAALSGVAALLLLAFGMKAAAFPLNAWLPASYHTAPPEISALFAALLTKVGLYALLRTLVVILPSSRDVLEPALMIVAILTLLLGPLGAIAETNLRRAMGFLVIGGIGSVMAGLSLGGNGAIAGAGFYMLHSMLTLAAFYLVAGLVEQRTGEVDTRRMGGVYAASAPLSLAFLLLFLAVAGVPPMLGFWPKLLLLEASLAVAEPQGYLLAAALLLNSLLTLFAGARLWSHVFWRTAQVPPDTSRSVDSGGWPRLATAMITLVVLAAGLWPNPLFAIAREGGADMVDPARYLAAVPLAERMP